VARKSPDWAAKLGTGDFFGVISCMARRPNLETIFAEEETTAIAVKYENFDLLISNNPSIAMKIIRYFSRLLRYYDDFLPKMINKSIGSRMKEDTPENLYDLGEYFYTKKRNLTYAGYAYLQFINEEPDNPLAEMARARMKTLDRSLIKTSPEKEGNLYIYEDQQIIFLQGEKGHALYVIQEGEVKITRFYKGEEVLLSVLKRGDIFGEMAILEDQPRSANAFANGNLKLMLITKQNFDFVIKNYPRIVTKIIELLSDRIWIIYRQMINMLISNPEIKIFDALYTQLLKNRVPANVAKPHTFDFGAEDLLKFTGMLNDEGWNIWKELKHNDKNFEISAEGKIIYDDISQIERKINLFRRQMEIQQNLGKGKIS
jgi:CRP-like cAMP-binding protein